MPDLRRLRAAKRLIHTLTEQDWRSVLCRLLALLVERRLEPRLQAQCKSTKYLQLPGEPSLNRYLRLYQNGLPAEILGRSIDSDRYPSIMAFP